MCVGELDQKLNVTHVIIAAGFKNVEYEPKQFPGLIYRVGKSNSVVLEFASGKIVVTGTSTIELVNQSSQSFTEKLAEWELRD